VDPVTVSTIVSRPIADVFAYVADIANHPEFCDHFAVDWHLTREDSFGLGAGARFKVKQRGDRFPWVDQTFREVEAPRRIVAVGRGGKYNRIRIVTVWELEPAGSGEATRVTVTTESVPVMPSDKLLAAVWRTRAKTKRRMKKALNRLGAILEEDAQRGRRATIAGGPRKPATGTPIR
jgi:uncharacterized protein YndB with AHSA1/START domain